MNELSISEKKELDLLIEQITVKKYFWHNEERIFDVEFEYNNECMTMISFPKCNVWHQPANFWNNHGFKYNMNNYLKPGLKKFYFTEKLKIIANKIYEKNKLKKCFI